MSLTTDQNSLVELFCSDYDCVRSVALFYLKAANWDYDLASENYYQADLKK